MPRRIVARAPTRIDFAGGTVDLWPIHLLLRAPLTVNAAIDLEATAIVEDGPGDGTRLESRDRGVSFRIDPGAALESALGAAPPELEFVVRLTYEFLGEGGPRAPEMRRGGVRVVTDCRAPAGSGLGGSSALGIALASALDRYTGRGLDADSLLRLTRGVETQVLAIPSGEQDYHPALRGGGLALHYTVLGTRVEPLPMDAAGLRSRILLLYTGVSRNSGLSNWDVFKRCLDGDRVVREALQAISDAAHVVRESILSADWDRVGAALGREWESRKRLSPAVTDKRIDRLIAGAREAGALSGKVCGAGGGGCLVLFVPPEARERVAKAASGLGAQVLDFSFTSNGVRLTDS